MGLDHTCWDGHSPRTRPKDGDGRPVPSCSEALPAEVTEATMYPHAQPGDSRRTPSTDDVAGICSVYPLANDPGVCQPNQPNLPSACLTDIPCISDLKCVSVPGTSCNQALAEPRCQKVECGEAGSPCSAEGQCLVGALCVGGVCSIPAKGCSVGAATACERSGRRLLLASGTVVFLVSLLSLRVRRPRRSN